MEVNRLHMKDLAYPRNDSVHATAADGLAGRPAPPVLALRPYTGRLSSLLIATSKNARGMRVREVLMAALPLVLRTNLLVYA